MSLPNQIAPQTLAGLKVQSPKPQDIYETAHATIQAHNQLIASLGPGATISGSNISSKSNIAVTSVSGSVKRGKFSTTIQSNPGSTTTLRIAFPSGTYSSAPFAQVIRNGGSGQGSFTYTEDVNGINIVITGAKEREVYNFQYTVQD